MANIHTVFKDDCVNGSIIGGDYVTGLLCYQGRQQGDQLWADTLEQLRENAEALKGELLAECGDVALYIYPRDDWTLKILN